MLCHNFSVGFASGDSGGVGHQFILWYLKTVLHVVMRVWGHCLACSDDQMGKLLE